MRYAMISYEKQENAHPGKSQPSIFAGIAALGAWKTKHPVKIRLDRDDDMIITGKGNYQGTFTKDYTIAPKNLAEPEVKIAPIDAQEYNGMAVTPAPSVSYEFGDGTYALSPVNDYTVAYANNKGTGTATVTVTGTGNFTGSKTAEFRIGQLITNESKSNCSQCNDSEPIFLW